MKNTSDYLVLCSLPA